MELSKVTGIDVTIKENCVKLAFDHTEDFFFHNFIVLDRPVEKYLGLTAQRDYIYFSKV